MPAGYGAESFAGAQWVQLCDEDAGPPAVHQAQAPCATPTPVLHNRLNKSAAVPSRALVGCVQGRPYEDKFVELVSAIVKQDRERCAAACFPCCVVEKEEYATVDGTKAVEYRATVESVAVSRTTMLGAAVELESSTDELRSTVVRDMMEGLEGEVSQPGTVQ